MSDPVEYRGKLLENVHFLHEPRSRYVLIAEGLSGLQTLLGLASSDEIDFSDRKVSYEWFKKEILGRIDTIYLSDEAYLGDRFYGGRTRTSVPVL